MNAGACGLDIEDEQPVMPVAHIQPVTHAQRMVAARFRPVAPWIYLAAGFPLSGDPPFADLDRVFRVLEVENHHDRAAEAFDGRRKIHVAAVEIEAVNAAPDRVPGRNLTGVGFVGHVVNADTDGKIVRFAGADQFVVTDHDIAAGMHLVGVGAVGHSRVREKLGVFRVGDVDDAGPERIRHVADIGRRAVDADLAAPGAVEKSDLFKSQCARHYSSPIRSVCTVRCRCRRPRPGRASTSFARRISQLR